MNLIERIRSEKFSILSRLYLGKAHWDVLLERAERLDPDRIDDNNDEQVWTFLLACVYAFVEGGPSLLASRLTFCEFKWYSDISCDVKYDRHRNQLARVIENAVFFQSPDRGFPTDLYVCLVTPACFRDRIAASRLYRYKWAEYTTNRVHIVQDLNSSCSLLPVDHSLDVSDRIRKMGLTWISFEELAFPAPESDLKFAFAEYYRAHAGDLLAEWPAG